MTAAATAATSVRRLWSPGTATTVRWAAGGGIPNRSRSPWTTSVGTVTASSSGRRLGGSAPPERRGGRSGNARQSTPTAPTSPAVRHATRAPAERPPTTKGSPASSPRGDARRRPSTPRRAGGPAPGCAGPRHGRAARRARRRRPLPRPRRRRRRDRAPRCRRRRRVRARARRVARPPGACAHARGRAQVGISNGRYAGSRPAGRSARTPPRTSARAAAPPASGRGGACSAGGSTRA